MHACFCANTCGPARARIQWGANGDFLIGYGVAGTTLVSASGQSSELPGTPPSSSFGPDEAPGGALNEQGTLVAFPQSNGAGNVNIMLYRVDASNGKALNPVTMASLTDDNGMTVDFSPDGSKIGICAGKGLYVVDVHLPNPEYSIRDVRPCLPSLPGSPLENRTSIPQKPAVDCWRITYRAGTMEATRNRDI
jgi:hypothetical protein